MKLRYILLSAFCLLAAGQAEAQCVVNGTFSAATGMGETAPYEGDVKLDVHMNNAQIQPYVSIKGISHSSSEQLDDRTYIYSKSGNKYTSSSDMKSSGFDLKYGVSILFPMRNEGMLKASFGANNLRKKTTGTWQEKLLQTDGTVLSDYLWNVNMPRQNSDGFSAGASYSLGKLRLDYKFTHALQREGLDMECDGGFGGHGFNLYHRTTETTTNSHRATASYDISLGKQQTLTAGLSYLNDEAEREHVQQMGTADKETPAFSHSIQTASASLAYKYGSRWLRAMVRMEYSYTHMANDAAKKNLNDVIPQVHLEWSMSSKDVLVADYRMIVKRPDIELLDPTKLYASHSEDYGNPNLEGIHINNFSLAYRTAFGRMNFSTTAGFILVEDGFNAIWMEKDNIRLNTWGNEGVRRAVSITPQLKWTSDKGTSVTTRATLLWDKRIARAIHMEKEHWGITAELGLNQTLPCDMELSVNGRYSKGNTIDLYSHETTSLKAGASLTKLLCKRHKLTLAYDYNQNAKAIITQGAYTGSVYTRPDARNTVRLSAVFAL